MPLDILRNLPDLVILLAFTVLVPAYAYFLYSALLFIYRKRELQHDAYLGINMFNSSIAISAFLLTFTLIQGFGGIQKIRSEIKEETAIIEQLDSALLSFGEQESLDVRDVLKRYIKSVIHQEWEELSSPSGKHRVSKELSDLTYAISHFLPVSTEQQKELYDKCVTYTEDLAKTRHIRMNHIGEALAPIFMVGIFLLLTTSTLLFFYLSKKNAFSAHALLFQMTALGILCGLVAIYDQPFTGESGITARAYERSLEMMDERSALNDD